MGAPRSRMPARCIGSAGGNDCCVNSGLQDDYATARR